MLKEEIKSGKSKIAVYGLGQIGSAIAAVWLRCGAYVIGVDKSKRVIEEAQNGFPNSNEYGVKEAFAKAIEENRFMAIEDGIEASRLSKIKFVIVPLINNGTFTDYTAIKDVAEKIGKGLKKNDIVCFNTSLPVGSCDNIILPTLISESNLKPEEDFFFIYSPERVLVGRIIKDIEENYPAIVSGVGSKSRDIARELYSLIAKKGVIVMNDIRAAELEKLFEGIYRDVNIALANELAILCNKLNIDFWEVREAANSQPYCNIHKAGVGVGGICIPVYPKFVLDIAKNVKVECNIVEQARMLNDEMPIYAARDAMRLTNKKNVTILGLAFRGNVADARLSPSYAIIEEFVKNGYNVRLHDPYVSESIVPRGVEFTKEIDKAIRDTNLIFIATDHDEYRMIEEEFISNLSSDVIIYDGRNVLDRDRFKNIKIYGIGRKNEIMV
ncbi:MAG: nucleotide sugar dehydrogenase [Candidatus Nitrosocaldaceae archaeon]